MHATEGNCDAIAFLLITLTLPTSGFKRDPEAQMPATCCVSTRRQSLVCTFVQYCTRTSSYGRVSYSYVYPGVYRPPLMDTVRYG